MDVVDNAGAAPDGECRGDGPEPAKCLNDVADDSGTHDDPAFEAHRMGLTLGLSDGDVVDVGFDVIAVHGLHGQSQGTWREQSSTVPASTWLSSSFWNATLRSPRVILYGYDSDEDSGRCYTLRGVYQEAEALLDSLLSLRTPDITDVRRPIYFVSHDIGGLVVKAALVLARSDPQKYADLVDSTRAMIFFGYPHAPRTQMDLEEQVFRLLSLKSARYRQGNMVRLAKSLAETIAEVNGAFIHTKMVTQAMLVNIVSTHEDAAQRVFDTSTAIWGTPFEYRVRTKEPHLELTTGDLGDSHLAKLPDENWLAGDISNTTFRTIGDIVHEASPVYPSLESEPAADNNGELEDLLQTTSSRLLHIQCPSGADRASEMVRNYLDANRVDRRMLLYFRFCAHDVRFNNVQDMLATFVAQIVYNQLEVMASYMNTMAREHEANQARTTEDMFYHWDFLRGDSFVVDSLHVLGCLDECDDSALWFLAQFQSLIEKAKAESALRIVIVTTKGTAKDQLIADALSKFPRDLVARMDYTPPSPLPLQDGFELSMLGQDDARYAIDGLRDDVQALISSCANDEKLCRLLIESLKASSHSPESVLPLLLDYSKTHEPEIIFKIILDQMPEKHQPWAQKLLSWVLLSFRPLRTSEFCRVSDLCLGGEDKTGKVMGTAQLSTVLRYFMGMLIVVHGEVQFSHPAIRPWLKSEMEGKEWYGKTTARERHLDIVQTCLEHLRDDTHPAETWAAQLPYATQFWTSHYKQAGPVDGVVESIFESQPTLRRWINAYTPILHEASREPLPVAAHFGLDDVVAHLLAKPGAEKNAGARGQALVEAARTGELLAVRIILESYPSGLDFDDVYLHKAVKAASSSHDRELFRQLVNHIPDPPYPIPQPKHNERAHNSPGALAEATDALEVKDGRSKSGDPEGRNNVDKREKSPDDRTKQPPQPSELDDPFLWLADILLRACSVGEDEIVAKLLSLGASPNPPKSLSVRGNTPLHISAIRCHLGTTRLLVAAGASLTATNDLGRTPLHAAAAYGSHEVTSYLLDHGAAIDTVDTTGRTPLEIACIWGKLAAAEALLQHRVFREYAPTNLKSAPLVIAADLGYYGVAEVLLRHGFDPNIPQIDGATALWYAVRTNRLDICRLLLDNKADPDLTPDGATPPLIEAVKEGSLDAVKLLVEHGVDIEKKEALDEAWQRTPLILAACHGKAEIVRYLLSRHADPHATDLEGWTAIWSAARFGYTDVVRLLVEAKADVNSVCSDREWTPMHAAAGYPDTVHLLIECGGDINKISPQSGTPLDYAIRMGYCYTARVMLDGLKSKPDLTLVSTQEALQNAVLEGYTDVVSLILEAGGDVNTAGATNESLLSTAMRQDGETLVRTILEYRPDIDVKDANDDTPLHCISQRTPVASVRLVVNAGAKLNAMNRGRNTPLMIAIWEGNNEVVRYLLGKAAVTATLNTASFRDRATPLHLACQRGSLETVQLLIERGSDTNFDCTSLYGTPLIAATLRTKDEPDTEKEQIMQHLLQKGAVPTASAGDFGHPIISASLACSAKQVQLLLDSGSPIDVRDSLGRKPVHLACYNSLEVLNVLGVADSDFAARDVVDRVPLHYAVLSGQVRLVEEVVARSERVGIGIDVQDKDGWTPLLWAARASGVATWGDRRDPSHNDVISFLLAKGASTETSARGLLRHWTAVDVAHYHNADTVAGLIAAQSSPPKTSASDRIKKGLVQSYTCECCLVEISGVHFSCPMCIDRKVLCFKCYGSKASIHPQHDLREEGYEWDSDDADSNMSGPIDGRNEDDGQDQQRDSLSDFDDEIVDDDDSSISTEPEGSTTPQAEHASASPTVASITGAPQIVSLKARIGGHR